MLREIGMLLAQADILFILDKSLKADGLDDSATPST